MLLNSIHSPLYHSFVLTIFLPISWWFLVHVFIICQFISTPYFLRWEVEWFLLCFLTNSLNLSSTRFTIWLYDLGCCPINVRPCNVLPSFEIKILILSFFKGNCDPTIICCKRRQLVCLLIGFLEFTMRKDKIINRILFPCTASLDPNLLLNIMHFLSLKDLVNLGSWWLFSHCYPNLKINSTATFFWSKYFLKPKLTKIQQSAWDELIL